MDLIQQRTGSAFFVPNVWEKKANGGLVEWRGEMLHVDSGTTLRFEDWPDMVVLIADALDRLRLDGSEQDAERRAAKAVSSRKAVCYAAKGTSK